MVVDTSIGMVFCWTGQVKGMIFLIGTFHHDFCKIFTSWENINISLAVCNKLRPSCLTCISFIGHFVWWPFKQRFLAIYYLFSLENTKRCRRRVRGRANILFSVKQCCMNFERLCILLPFHNIVNREGKYKWL